MSSHTLQISYYKTLLLSMKQKITGGKSNVAKPVLVLATINLIEKGEIIGNKIEFNENLINEYNRLITSYNEVNTLCQYPFYYLRNDGFYHIKGTTDRRTPSAKYIRENIDYAYLDDGLWELLQDASVREEFRAAIINHYLKEK